MTRLELAAICIGITLLVLGCVSLLTASLRLQRGSKTLLTFGCWCGLYGARLLALQAPVRSAVGGAPGQWLQFIALMTYAINVPIVAFVASLIGEGWGRSIRWLLVAAAAFALGALVWDLATATPGAALDANTWLVLAMAAIGFANIVHSAWMRRVRTPLADPIVVAGGLLLLAFVVNENLGEMLVPSTNIEPIGVLIFIVCLGYAVGRSVFRTEAELIGVQRELQTARQIQRSLLPDQVPRTDSVDVAVRYLPMSAVAGDLYDFVEIGPSTVGLLVADVMGHGVPAALVASMVKLAFSIHVDQARDPAALLASMNRALCSQHHGSYVTAVYAVIDCSERRVTFASAGHPPPLFRRRTDGLVDVGHAPGIILGFVPDVAYTNVTIDGIANGDRLFLYSDGVAEARNRADEFFDKERIARWLTTINASRAEQFAEAAMNDLIRWCGQRPFDDDVTFVVAEVSA